MFSQAKRKGQRKASALKGQCPDYAHARASSVFSSKDNRTVILTRQDFLPDRTADSLPRREATPPTEICCLHSTFFVLFTIWLGARRIIAILLLAGPSRDPKK